MTTKEKIIKEFEALSDEDKTAVINSIAAAAITEVKEKGIGKWCRDHWKALIAGAVTIAAAMGALGLTGCSSMTDAQKGDALRAASAWLAEYAGRYTITSVEETKK